MNTTTREAIAVFDSTPVRVTVSEPGQRVTAVDAFLSPTSLRVWLFGDEVDDSIVPDVVMEAVHTSLCASVATDLSSVGYWQLDGPLFAIPTGHRSVSPAPLEERITWAVKMATCNAMIESVSLATKATETSHKTLVAKTLMQAFDLTRDDRW